MINKPIFVGIYTRRWKTNCTEEKHLRIKKKNCKQHTVCISVHTLEDILHTFIIHWNLVGGTEEVRSFRRNCTRIYKKGV